MSASKTINDKTIIYLNPNDFTRVRDLIYKKTGMLFPESKNYYIESRVRQRMDALGLRSFDEYYKELVFSQNGGEDKEFIEAITINETYFFRDFPQLQGFAEQVLTNYTQEIDNQYQPLVSIWSAACSTGEEPYTLAIILKEMLGARFKTKITATDIDTTVLQRAQDGEYSERSMKDTPLEYRAKYFKKKGESWWVDPALTNEIDFRILNLIDRVEMRKMRGFDFVFCRNVLIYFDDESRRKVVSYLYDALKPGGYLFLGHSESIGRISAAFELQNIGGFLCYRRPK